MQEPTQDEILKLFSVIHRKTQMYLNNEVTDYGLTSGQVPFIMITCENGKMAQNRFVEFLDMNKSTVTKMIAKLEAEGYLRREANAQDSRSFDVYPTEKAYAIFPVLQKTGEKWVEEITDGMTEVERAVFFELLGRSAKKATRYFEPDTKKRA